MGCCEGITVASSWEQVERLTFWKPSVLADVDILQSIDEFADIAAERPSPPSYPEIETVLLEKGERMKYNEIPPLPRMSIEAEVLFSVCVCVCVYVCVCVCVCL